MIDGYIMDINSRVPVNGVMDRNKQVRVLVAQRSQLIGVGRVKLADPRI